MAATHGAGLGMQRGVGRVWVFLALFPAIQGCHGGGGSGASMPASTTPFSRDLPVPRGFRLLSGWEGTSEGTAGRVVSHEYIGRADRDHLLAFYRSQMPLVRWRELDGEVSKDRYQLLFDRGDETCTISVRSAGVFSFGRTIVKAEITPRAHAVDAEQVE